MFTATDSFWCLWKILYKDENWAHFNKKKITCRLHHPGWRKRRQMVPLLSIFFRGGSSSSSKHKQLRPEALSAVIIITKVCFMRWLYTSANSDSKWTILKDHGLKVKVMQPHDHAFFVERVLMDFLQTSHKRPLLNQVGNDYIHSHRASRWFNVEQIRFCKG